MSAAEEFSKWATEFANAPVDDDGESPQAELAWRAMNAIVDGVECGTTEDGEAAALAWANGMRWAAFWIAAAAVSVAAIVRFT